MGIQIIVKPVVGVYQKHLTSVSATSGTLIEKVASHKGGEKSVKILKSEEKTEHPGVIFPESDTIIMEVQGGSTINLGNFESARIGVHLRLPCNKDSLEETYKFATDWIGEKINSAVKDAKG